jgi:TatD DNase family protein
MELFDSHAHLQDPIYTADLDDVIARAITAGVTRILLPASDMANTVAAAKIARTRQGLYYSAGCHPHEAASFSNADKANLHAMLLDPDRGPLLAIGEIGLDYHYDFSPRPAQKRVFIELLDIACDAHLPMIIHEREATADCLSILHDFQQAGRLSPFPGVFHCFSGSVETAELVLEMGFCLGFDGPITFSNARKALEVIRMCPLDRLMIETDSPYLTPSPFRGQRNEPMHVSRVVERLAEEIGLSLSETAQLTTQNACRCFGLNRESAPRLIG